MVSVPIVYTIQGCDACVKLLNKWNAEGIQYEERRADLSQEMMEEARSHGDVVPIIIFPDGHTEEGFEGGDWLLHRLGRIPSYESNNTS